MINTLMDRLRGARRIELYAAIVVLAVLALIVLRGERADPGGELPLERRLERILSRIDGAGEVSVMINEGSDEAGGGMVVIAAGLRDVRAYLQLQRAAQAATGMDISRIAIIGNDGRFDGGT